MRKCFLDNLPKKEGIGSNKNKMVIDWQKSIGYNIPFIYEDVEGELYISDFNKHNRVVTIIYNDKEFKMSNSQLIESKIGKVVGKFTRDFKILDDKIIDDKRNLTILKKQYIQDKYKRMYKYHCNICEYEDWALEKDLLEGCGCSVCSNHKTKLGVNTIWDTDRWMCDLGVSEEDAKTHTKCSGKKINVTCPHCGKVKQMVVHKIYYRKSIGCNCSDNISYPEKILISVLDQLKIKYVKEYSSEWSNNKRYDFYLNNYNTIIECHGIQHYKYTGLKRTLEQEQNNDEYKKELALQNKISNYIILDCRESELEFIKNSILNSKLNKLFDLNNINWFQCEKFALSNRIKEVCEYWNQKEEWETTKDLCKVFHLSKSTICKFLRKGNKLFWCNYNPKDEYIKGVKNSKGNRKSVCVFKDDVFLGKFESYIDLERNSEKLFGIKLLQNGICDSIKLSKPYKGFTFEKYN